MELTAKLMTTATKEFIDDLSIALKGAFIIDVKSDDEKSITITYKKVTEHACTCTADQYGGAIDPNCILHGEK